MRRMTAAVFVFLFATIAYQSFGASLEIDQDLARKGEGFLKTYCLQCHGGKLAQNFTTRASLIQGNDDDENHPFITPGKPSESKIWTVIEEEYMPPEESKQPTDADIQLLRRWIEAGAYIPTPTRVSREHVAEQTILKMIEDDLSRLQKSDTKYVRYFSLLHLWNNLEQPNPITDKQLRQVRAAVSKLVNSLSLKSRIVRPREVDEKNGTLLAIDIRDYGWTEWHWTQILEQYPYGIKTNSKKLENIYQIIGTDVPYLRADWFVNTASRPPLYHELLRIPRNAKTLEHDWGVNIYKNFLSGQLARAAFQKSGISQQNRMIERHDTSRGRYYWKSYDMKPGSNVERDFFRSPLGPVFEENNHAQRAAFQHDGGEIIFGLPNGLQAYMLVDNEDRRIDKGPVDVVQDRFEHAGDAVIVNGVSCIGCHKYGMRLDFKDAIRPLYEERRGQKVADQVLNLFPKKKQMQSLIKQDKAVFLLALDEAVRPFLLNSKDDKEWSVQSDPAEPISQTVKMYLRELTVQVAALELGVSPEVLKAQAARMPRLRRYGIQNFSNENGTVSRINWERAYRGVARELGLGTPIHY